MKEQGTYILSVLTIVNSRNIKQFRNKKKLLGKYYYCKVWARNITMQDRNNLSLFSYKYLHFSLKIFTTSNN